MRKRALLVVQTARVGDAVLTVPLLAELRRCRPESRVTLLTTVAGSELLRGQGLVDECRVLDKRWTAAGLASWFRCLAWLRRGGFDEAVAVQRSRRTGQAIRVSGAPIRVGFLGAPGAGAYTHRVTPPAGPVWRRLLELSRPLGGMPERAAPPLLHVQRTADAALAERLAQLGLNTGAGFVALAPGSARALKRWLPERFAEVAASLAAAGFRTALVGSAAERPLCEAIAEAAGGEAEVLAGRLSLPEWVAALARARAVVANDSAAGHVAAAVGTPVVSVFGPTAPSSGFVPAGERVRVVEHSGLSCRPCSPRGPRRCPEGHWRCMRDLASAEVLAAAVELATERRQPLARTVPG